MPKQRQKSIPTELPPCKGPKLHLFPYHNYRIQWLERLGNDDNDSSQGYVFRAKINNLFYAVKVFKFYDPMESEYYWGPLIEADMPLDIAAYYNDPFYAECRAYGLINHCLNKRITPSLSGVATPCHGFLFLKEKDEKILSKRGVDLEYDYVDQEYQQKTPGGRRARAIVKDVAPSDPGVDEKSLRDIRLDNYGGGQILDFGSSWTEPHLLLDALKDELLRGAKEVDRVHFKEMVEEEKIPNNGVIHSMTLRS